MRAFFSRSALKEESAEILAYLHGRELSDSTIRIFGLGATPPHSDGATRAMRELGFTDDELVSAGISVRPGRPASMICSGSAPFFPS